MEETVNVVENGNIESKVNDTAPQESHSTETKQVTEAAPKKEAPAKKQTLKEHFDSIAASKQKEKQESAQGKKEVKIDANKQAPASQKQDTDKWVPTFKFKVKDKEYDMPEWAKAAITTKDAEKEFVDLFTKAEGIEPIKMSRDEAVQRAQQAETDIGSMREYVSSVLKLRDEGQLDKFFKHLKVSDEQIVQHALKIVEKNSLPPEQKELYNSLEATQSQLDEREAQFQQMQSMLQQAAHHAKMADLQSSLAKLENAQYAKNYDDICGEPGKFHRLVSEYGKNVYLTTGEDLTAEQAIQAVKNQLGKAYIPQEKPVIEPEQAVKKDLPVIPNISGRNVSPVNKPISRTSDLKRLYKEKFG